MTLLLIAIVALTVLALVGANFGYSWFNEIVCPLCTAMGFLGLIAYACLIWFYVAAEYQAGIINREYGTNYTQKEVFYASDVIETVRELNRTRVEVNGDIVTGKRL